MSEVLAQGVGILGAALSIFAYQFKDNQKYFVLLALSGVCFGVHFLLLGAFTGALLNFINVVRGFGYTFERNKKPYITLVLSVTLYVSATVFTHGDALSILACAAQVVGCVSMFWGHKTGMRLIQFTLISPAWLIYNGCTGSIGGVLCETFNMTSIIVYFIRTKLLKKEITR